MTGTREGAEKAAETKRQEGGNKSGQQGEGRGTNLSEEDRRRGGEHSQGGGRKE